MSEQQGNTTQAPVSSAIGDSDTGLGSATDPNGADTLVGVPHPENRQSVVPDLPALPDYELSDYDAEEPDTDLTDLPPDEEEGRSFSGLNDVSEPENDTETRRWERHQMREEARKEIGDDDRLESDATELTGTLDNQTGQPRRFEN